jgi:hypothetical protein
MSDYKTPNKTLCKLTRKIKKESVDNQTRFAKCGIAFICQSGRTVTNAPEAIRMRMIRLLIPALRTVGKP